MTQKTFTVENKNGLNVRDRPNTSTGKIVRRSSFGEVFTVDSTFPVLNQVWGRIGHGETTPTEYICISIDKKLYAREQIPSDLPILDWKQAIDQWARGLGYRGPTP